MSADVGKRFLYSAVLIFVRGMSHVPTDIKLPLFVWWHFWINDWKSSPTIDINVKSFSNMLQWHNCFAFIISSLSKYFKIFQWLAVLLFLSRLCKKKFLVSRNLFCQQIPSADFCRQQIFFLSADSISKFLLSADLFFVSKYLCRRHGHDAHAGIYSFAPGLLLVGEVFAFGRRAISLLWWFHSFCRTFQEVRPPCRNHGKTENSCGLPR